MLSLEGKQLGNYDVIRRIRVGGMGAVYEGRQRTAFDRRVAIKVILGDYADDRDMRRRFAREARTIARLHHPHVLPLIEFGDEQGILYLVMPFIEGGTLTSYLRRVLPDLGEVAAVYQQLLDAVEYAHEEGLIHRDIKSSNVLLEMRRSGPPYIYLADFGLVRTMRPGANTQVGKPIPLDQVPGTPHYMAPEQTLGIVTPLTDIYALGVMLYQLLTGRLPYNDADEVKVIEMHLYDPIPKPSALDASIPTELDDVVSTAMAKRPEERYRNVADLRRAFLAAIKGPVATVLPVEPPPSPRHATTRVLRRGQERLDPPMPEPRDASVPPPEPIVLPKRQRQNAEPVAVREWVDQRDKAARLPTTDNVRQSIQSPRTTEEIIPARRGIPRVRLLVLVAALISLLLLSLIVVPRVLGIALPAGIPLLGGSPDATIYVQPQSQARADTYLLTASPQVQTPNLADHTIPARVLTSTTLTASTTVQTTGSKTSDAIAAQGMVHFINAGGSAVVVPTSQVFTSATGQQFHLLADLQVPGSQNGTAGNADGAVVALTAGVSGNIAAHTINGPCCGNGGNALTVSNPAAFAGGADAQTTHYVAQSDLDNAQSQLKGPLEQQINQQFQKLMTADEVMVGVPTYNENVSSSIPINGAGNTVQVTLSAVGSVTVYNRKVAEQTAEQLLSARATQAFGPAYHLRGNITEVGLPTFTGAKGDQINLDVSVRGVWVYQLTDAQLSTWQQSIKGATTAAARAYLDAQPGVASVEIHLPFNADHLPNDVSQIKLILQSS